MPVCSFTTITDTTAAPERGLAVWLGRDNRNRRDFVFEAFLKMTRGGVQGVKHTIQRYNRRLTMDQIREVVSEHGVFSPRPYRLAQRCDGSIEAPVFALLADFCRCAGIDIVALHHQSYPDEDHSDLDPEGIAHTIAFAEWQGVAYPDKWDEAAFDGLYESLGEVNWRTLRGDLDDMVGAMPEGCFPFERSGPEARS